VSPSLACETERDDGEKDKHESRKRMLKKPHLKELVCGHRENAFPAGVCAAALPLQVLKGCPAPPLNQVRVLSFSCEVEKSVNNLVNRALFQLMALRKEVKEANRALDEVYIGRAQCT
jgi:hypothetical protein